jgi:hypothetical protein
MLRRYEDRDFPARDLAAMPADRLDQIPWLVCGAFLVSPFAARAGGLTAREAEAIEEMGMRLERDGRAGLLPADCACFWFSPDGRCTSLTPAQGWLRLKALQHITVDRHLLEVMHRVEPVTVLARRVEPVLVPVPAARRGRPRKAHASAGIEAAA